MRHLSEEYKEGYIRPKKKQAVFYFQKDKSLELWPLHPSVRICVCSKNVCILENNSNVISSCLLVLHWKHKHTRFSSSLWELLCSYFLHCCSQTWLQRLMFIAKWTMSNKSFEGQTPDAMFLHSPSNVILQPSWTGIASFHPESLSFI